jgi:hypothetical protein
VRNVGEGRLREVEAFNGTMELREANCEKVGRIQVASLRPWHPAISELDKLQSVVYNQFILLNIRQRA